MPQVVLEASLVDDPLVDHLEVNLLQLRWHEAGLELVEGPLDLLGRNLLDNRIVDLPNLTQVRLSSSEKTRSLSSTNIIL